jgi:diguanylate cyclase (GGDEF)-like protein/PAS domain S-box-containing protein
MTADGHAQKANARGRYSLAVFALLAFIATQLAFLGFHAFYKFSHEVVLIETFASLFVTTVCIAIVARENHDTKKADAVAERQLSHLADFATDLYWETDLEGYVITCGGRMMKTIAPDKNSVLGLHYLEIIKLEEREREKMLSALQTIQPYSDILSVFRDPAGKKYHVSLSATPRFNRDGNVVGYLGVGTNVTNRIEAQGRLRHMAEHDMLTGLANRYAFQSRIEKDIEASHEDENVAMLAIDLDNFKAINDSFGHQAGDALLNLVAKRIRKTIRGDDWAARLGGDEFVVVVRNTPNPMDACLMASRLVTALSHPYKIGGTELHCSASVGVACAPLHAGDSGTLMKYADLALYDAKGSGRSCYRLFEAPTNSPHAFN